MVYAKIQNGVAIEYPIKEEQVRRVLDNVSLPATLTNDILEPFGFALVDGGTVGEIPNPTKYMSVTLGDIFKDADGKWKQSYKLEPVPEIFYEKRLNARWDFVREKRYTLMNNFQWRIDRYNRELILGITPKDDISILHAYMQSLADITSQHEDPFFIVFPAEPI